MTSIVNLPFFYFLNLLNLNAFRTTVIEEKDIAAAAIMGDRVMPRAGNSAPAATGMPMELYMSAQNRFCLTVLNVAREISRAVRTSMRELFESITSAESMATSVPAPIAIPISASARAGASFMPSPTMATSPLCFSL